jgi:outer membrane protein assembly factor BamB
VIAAAASLSGVRERIVAAGIGSPQEPPAQSPPAVAWTGWRGASRDGKVPWLPPKLAAKPTIVWRRPLRVRGLGGVAATRDQVIVSDRELGDKADAWRCLDPKSGSDLWTDLIPCVGHLDFGNSPRSTPLIDGDLVYLASAFGQLQCVKRADGDTVWAVDLKTEFKPQAELPWGYCASPLLVDGKLIVNPGAADASLVALDAKTGCTVWKSPGRPPSYGSFLAARLGGRLQIVGHDSASLGGWDASTGQRLWQIPTGVSKEFGVPTPIVVGDRLLVCSENQGTRLYGFQPEGKIDPRPLAVNPDLTPDCHTPVVVGDRLFGVWSGLYCLDLKAGLKTRWHAELDPFAGYASIIASDTRLLVTSIDGDVVLAEAAGDKLRIAGQWRVFPDDHGVYSHPALVGSRLYLRGSSEIVCIDLLGR